MSDKQPAEQRSKILQSVLLLALLVFAVYGGFILLVHLRGGA